MKKILNKFQIILFAAILFIVPILTKLEDKKIYSTFENRALASMPELSKETLFSGDYFSGINNYFSDHIVYRDKILLSYVKINRKILRKNVVNDIVYGNGALVSYHNTNYFDKNLIDEKNSYMIDNLSLLNEHIKNNNGEFYYIGIPEQFSMLRNLFPKNACNENDKLNYIENIFFSNLEKNNIKYINMHEKFLESGNYIEKYSLVDHHFNYFGAFDTYSEIIKAINKSGEFNLNPLKIEDMDFKAFNQRYLGSRNRKIYDSYPNNEKLYIGYPKNKISFIRYDNGEKVESTMFKLPDENAQYISYAAYMGGDIAETVIDTQRESLPNLLIFGDSFTNPLESLLYYNFNKTYILDLRHYDKKTLYEYIEEVKPDIVLCVRDDTAYLMAEGNGKFK